MMKTFNIEAFLTRWWSPSLAPFPSEMEEWIQNSYLENEVFLKELFSEQEKVLPQSHSIFGKNYNFYEDCILRHLRSNTTAFTNIKEKNDVDHWSYERVHQCVNYHVDKWSYHSPQQGQLIVILGSTGLHLLISLLTALRFGLKICYLPNPDPGLGVGLIKKCIVELQPDLISSEDPSFEHEGIPVLTINEKGLDEENHNPYSFAYPAHAEVVVATSLYTQETFSFCSLSAHHLYLSALKEGLVTLNLLQHPYWASPLASSLSTEPCHCLTSLLCGVTRVHVPDEIMRKNPLILEDERINLLGISHELQHLWTSIAGVPTRYLKACYKSPFDMNFQGWKAFTSLNKIEKIPIFHLLVDNSMGGSTLFSKSSLDVYQSYLRPTLASCWALKNINGSGEEALNGFGIYQVSTSYAASPLTEGNLTLSQFDHQFMLTGFIQPCRNGSTFPVDEVEEAVNELEFIEACLLHPVQKMGMVFSKYFILLVFVTPMQQLLSEEDKLSWTSEIERQISEKVGAAYLPNHIEYFPLLPKMKAFGIDRNWCVNQYNSGFLNKKKNQPSYQTLSVLKKLVQRVNNRVDDL